MNAQLPAALAAALILVTALAVPGAPATAVDRAPPAIGQPAPDFTGIDSNARTVHLADLRGKIVVLEWSNHECPYVGKHYRSGNMQALQKEATAAGALWFTVLSSAPGTQGSITPGEANALTVSRGAAPTAVIMDPSGTIGRLYAARTTPHMFVIDGAGVLRYMGGIDDKPTTNIADVGAATNYVRIALNSVRAGTAVANPVTRPYGCSVKYD